MKRTRAKSGHNASRQTAPADKAPPPQPETQPAAQADLSPLDYALAVMRDETQPAALRISMAKAAMPYLHARGAAGAAGDEPQEKPQDKPDMSDLELARRIAHILVTSTP